ncbi:NAD(P)-dependent oxidoreductase [Streptomyces xiamenensis]
MTTTVIFGAGGRAGRAAVAEARRRGHEVRAVVRDPGRYAGPAGEGVRVVAGDVTDPATVARLVEGQDAVLATAAVYGEGTDAGAFFPAAARALLAAAGSRRLVVAGLAPLLPDPVTGVPVYEGPGFPAEYRPFVLAHRAGFEVLEADTTGVDWLCVSPAGDFDHGAGRSGRPYRVGPAAEPANRIPYPDFAVALLDEIERPAHRRTQLAISR